MNSSSDEFEQLYPYAAPQAGLDDGACPQRKRV
jgi:hypothetical protein